MINVFVGDIYYELAEEAIKHDSSAYLLSHDNIEEFLDAPKGTVYTCIADLGSVELLDQICHLADRIYYCPPDTWSDASNKQKQWTETVIAYYSQFGKVQSPIHINQKYDFLSNDYLQDTRKADDQFWVVGCSVTYGTGLEQNQIWKYHLAKKLGLPYSDLSAPASSIIWQSDQICRADIRSGDKIFWQLTSPERIPVIHNKQLFHLTGRRYEIDKSLLKKFDPNLLDNDSTLWHNVLAVRRASNFCRKVGAKLVVLGLLYDWNNLYMYYNIPEFEQCLYWPKKIIDYATDNEHPGPLQHIKYAEKFLKKYQELYN